MTLILADTSTIGGPALGALIVALIWGILLLLLGAKLLRPMVVLAALLTGIMLAVVVARTWVPETPLWAAAAVGGVLGVIAGALLYRPTVAGVAACVGAVTGAVVAWAVIAGGALDTQPRESGHGLVASMRESALPGDGARSSAELLDIFMTPPTANSAEASTSATTATTVGDRILADVSELLARAMQRSQAALAGTAPAYRTLLYGCIATGAVIGFIAGLLATTMVARILTSAAGAGLTMVSAVPLLALAGYSPLPAGARAWAIALGSLVVVGVVLQTVIARKTASATPRKHADRASKPQPATA
jgi:ElaB/YqjD/DUF883 family membrane-anchored ribosome-binding protein